MRPLCGLEELFAPDTARGGVRFGNPHLAEETAWRNFTWRGLSVEAEAGPRRTRVVVGDAWSFLAEPGIAVRGFTVDDGIAFSAQALECANVRIAVKGLQPAPDAVLRINGQPATFTVEGDALRFTLPAGAAEVRFRGKTSPE